MDEWNLKEDSKALDLLQKLGVNEESYIVDVKKREVTKAEEIWEALKVRHVNVNRVKEARIETLESEFESLKMNIGDSLDVYAGRISQIATQASSLGHTMNEKRLVRKLLGSAFEERTKKKIVEEDMSGKLLFSGANGKWKGKQQKCEHCSCRNSTQEDFGHRRGKGRMSGKGRGDSGVQQDKSHIRCYRCNELGHYRSECPNLEGREEANLVQDEDEEPTLL
ncbi:uncharacterized protein LOC143547169 [Bidens hawaiensis]|uniref:uncharacterized protein LOC143547169 n=1 Tax=Bidens hawaiensis TaxID=980011 RepID=UPI00404B03DB